MTQVRKITLETVSTFGMPMDAKLARQLVDHTVDNPHVIVVNSQPFQVTEVVLEEDGVLETLRPAQIRYGA